jgi:SOS response regulatory protein OraA/RecX
MKITVTDLRAVGDGSEAVLTIDIVSGEKSQRIRGGITAAMLAELGFGLRCEPFAIDRETCERLLDCMKLTSAIKKGLSLLTFSRNTIRMMKRKLMQKGFSEEIARRASAYLAEHGFIDEQSDAELAAETMARRNLYGPNRIKSALFAKGFPEDVIRAALEETELDFDEICLARLYKLGIRPDDAEAKKKLVAKLTYYGFTYDHIKNAISAYREDE